MYRLAPALIVLLAPFSSGCWVTEQCGLPGDEDGDGLENCEDPDCAAREICGGLAPVPVGPILDDDDDDIDPDDDDDSTGIDDDDDAADDDDDVSGVDGYSFALAWEVTALEEDDDDAAEPNIAVEGEFHVTYWTDLLNGIPRCTQRVRVQGDATFGDGIAPSEEGANDGCSVCTGHVLFDPTTLEELSDPATDPDDCDPSAYPELGGDLGSLLLSSRSAGGFGDFLEFAIIDAATLLALGIEPSTQPPGPNRSHAAYVLVTPDSLADFAGLTGATNPAEAGSPWYGAFELVGEPGPTLNGAMLGQSLFVFGGSF